MARHELLGGLVQVYRRGEGRHWHCSASINGRQYRATTREDDLVLAKQFAEDWYLALRGKSKAGLRRGRCRTCDGTYSRIRSKSSFLRSSGSSGSVGSTAR
jgi:hypothetical protein